MKFTLDMLIRPKDYNPRTQRPVAFYQQKLDGIRVLVQKHFDRSITAITRNGKTNFWPRMKLMKQFQVFRDIPRESALDCELYIPGGHSTDVITAVNEKWESLKCTPFAIPLWDGELHFRDEPDRVKLHEVLYPIILTTNTWFSTEGPLTVAKVDQLKAEAKARRIEGFVAKRHHYRDWYKIKPIKTVDCVATGYIISDSAQHAGGMRGLEVSVWRGKKLRVIASVGSGFTAEFRHEIIRDWKKYYHRVCEVAYDSLAGQGQLKFPRFLRWRDDKHMVQCTYNQLEAP